MASLPLVSVIIPTFNRAALLRRAVDNVMDQSYSNLEILVVDDGSSDATQQVVEEIRDTRVRYVRHNINKGVSAARNTGIMAARGQYIALIDDDDEWRKDKLDKQVRAVEKHDAVLSASVMNGYLFTWHSAPCVTSDDLRKRTFDPSSLLVRTDVIRSVMFDENLKKGEDWDLFIRISQRYSIGWIAEPLLIYNDGNHPRATNQAKHLTGPELERRIAVLHKHRAFFGERWFRYHYADALLAYVGTREDKFGCIAFATRRCGPGPVISVLIQKLRLRLRRKWGGAATKDVALAS